MDIQAEIRDFLMSRRARLSPEAAGLPSGPNRRVAGLRRSEVAMIAGVSVEYYAKLERGDIGGASASVLDAVAGALQLDDTERAHLLDLARASESLGSRRSGQAGTTAPPMRPSLQWALDAIVDGVALVRNAQMDVLALNALGRAFYSPLIGSGTGTPNLARFQFLEPASHEFYPDWELFAEMCVGIMRSEAGRDLQNRALQGLAAELSAGSELFRTLWSAHDVRTHGAGSKRFHHPLVGDLTLAYEELAITAERGNALLIYTAEPGSGSSDRLRLLASWAARLPDITVDNTAREDSDK